MTDKAPLATSVSLDELLQANREQLDRMLRGSRRGEPVAEAPGAPARPAERPLPASPPPMTKPEVPDAAPAVRPAMPASKPAPAPAPGSSRRPSAATMGSLDLLARALGNIREEMDVALRRGAASAALRERHGEGPILADAAGRMVAGELGGAVSGVVGRSGLEPAPGDVILLSDPYRSAGAVGRVGEWLVIVPVFGDDALLGFSAIAGRLADVGGAAPGSRPANATSLFAEGLRIPPVKLFARGTLNEGVLDIVIGNGRRPAVARADLMALIAAARVGEQRLVELAGRFGSAGLRDGLCALLERGRQRLREGILALLPEEPRSFHDHLDDDGLGNGPFTLKLTVWREGEEGYLDWTGTAPQAPGPVNCLLSEGLFRSVVARRLRGAEDPSIGVDDGGVELLHVTLPEGSLLQPHEPAPLGGCMHALVRHHEVLSGALSRGAPQDAPAAGYGGAAELGFTGVDREGVPFHFVDAVFGGLPGGPQGDGIDGHGWWPRQHAAAAERIEGAFPILVERHSVRPDSGGAGRHRGGNGVEKVYRMLVDGRISLQDDRQRHPPWGNHGGEPGAHSEKWLLRKDGGRGVLPAKAQDVPVRAGDRVVFRTAGGGGWGDPLRREPEQVRLDAVRRLITAARARERYGVVLEGPQLTLDRRSGEELREAMWRTRAPRPPVDYGRRRDPGNEQETTS